MSIYFRMIIPIKNHKERYFRMMPALLTNLASENGDPLFLGHLNGISLSGIPFRGPGFPGRNYDLLLGG
jgi:hypothetical protein